MRKRNVRKAEINYAIAKKMAAGGEVTLIKAVVIGGTGAIGRHLVGFLLKHKEKVEKVTVLGRRKVEVRMYDRS